MSSDDLRVGAEERERALQQVRDACVKGRITLEEFSRRTEAALTAQTQADLAQLSRDLPPSVAAAPVPSAPPSGTRWSVACLGSNRLVGSWRPGLKNLFLAIVGSNRIDCSEAKLPGPVITITTVSIVGSTRVIVPEGCNVTLDGFAIIGSKQHDAPRTDPLPGAPTIRIQAYSLVGSVTVSS